MSDTTKKQHIRYIHEGDFAAEVLIHLESPHSAWGPYISPDDVRKMERVRKALREGDFPTASKLAKVYRLVAV